MDDVPLVRGGEPFSGLAGVIDRFARRERPRVHPAAERFALEEFGDDVRRASMPADIVDREDVGMIELAGRSRLLLEAIDPAGIGRQRVRDQLDGHVAAQPGIARPIHDAHAAGAQPAEDLVVIDPGAGRDARWSIWDHGEGVCGSAVVISAGRSRGCRHSRAPGRRRCGLRPG